MGSWWWRWFWVALWVLGIKLGSYEKPNTFNCWLIPPPTPASWYTFLMLFWLMKFAILFLLKKEWILIFLGKEKRRTKFSEQWVGLLSPGKGWGSQPKMCLQITWELHSSCLGLIPWWCNQDLWGWAWQSFLRTFGILQCIWKTDKRKIRPNVL